MKMFLFTCKFILKTLLIVNFVVFLIPEGSQARSSAPSRRKTKPAVTKPLTEKALSELNQITKKNPSLKTSPATQGIFTVKEPELKLISRSYQYQMGLKIQSLQPLGTVSSPIVGDFNLSSYPTQAFPLLEGGIRQRFSSPTPWTTWNLFGQVGYSSVKVPLVFASGYRANEATKLNTLRASLCVEVQRPLENISGGFLNTGVAIGKLFYTQTSFNDLAQFSESVPFGAMSVGTTYEWQDWVNISADYVFRHALKESDLQIQTHNFEFGVKVRW